MHAASTSKPIGSSQFSRRSFLQGVAGIAATAFVSGCSLQPNRVVIVVDNGRDVPMEVVLDNQPPVTIAPGDHKRLACETGIRELKVTCQGEVLCEGFKNLAQDSKKRFIFNPDGTYRYRVYEVNYSSSSARFSARDFLRATGLDERAAKAEAEFVAEMTNAQIQGRLLREVGELQPASAWFEIGYVDHELEPAPTKIIIGKYGSKKRRVLARLSQEDYAVLEAAQKNAAPSDEDLERLIGVLERMDEEPVAKPRQPIAKPFQQPAPSRDA